MSQDTEHLTKPGAEYVARLVQPELAKIFAGTPGMRMQ